MRSGAPPVAAPPAAGEQSPDLRARSAWLISTEMLRMSVEETGQARLRRACPGRGRRWGSCFAQRDRRRGKAAPMARRPLKKTLSVMAHLPLAHKSLTGGADE